MANTDPLIVDPFAFDKDYDELLIFEDLPIEQDPAPVLPLEACDLIIKAKADGHSAYIQTFHNTVVIFRLLSRIEYETYKSMTVYNGETYELGLKLIDRCTIYINHKDKQYASFYDIDPADINAGVIPSLAGQIINLSSFDSTDYLIELQDLNAQLFSNGDFSRTLTWHLKSNINNITAKDIDNMDVIQYGEALGAISHYSGGAARIGVPSLDEKLQSAAANAAGF